MIRRAVTLDELAAARAVVLGTVEHDLGHGYEPRWHWDLDRPGEVYLDHPRQAMFVAEDPVGGIVATAGIRVGGPRGDPELAQRYSDRDAVAQLVRVATVPAFRRRGLARRLVTACQEFVRADRGFRVICLHTNVRAAAAEPFWRSLPVIEIRDDRGTEPDPRLRTVHFELPLDAGVD